MGGGSDFEHGCSFCGLTRAASSPVMLSPACSSCGCALDARPAVVRSSVVPAAPLPWFVVRLVRALGVLVGALALYAAADVGFSAAGFAGGMIAIGAGGFLLLPFVPERLAARPSR